MRKACFSILLVVFMCLVVLGTYGLTKNELKVLVSGEVFTGNTSWINITSEKAEDIDIYVNKQFGVFCFILNNSKSMSCIPAVFAKPIEDTEATK